MKVSLHLTASSDFAWDNVVLPWFQKVKRAAANRGPVAVVVPHLIHAHFLRQKLIGHGVSLLGVKFLSPASLREILLRVSGLNIPLREHLRLLLAIAAA